MPMHSLSIVCNIARQSRAPLGTRLELAICFSLLTAYRVVMACPSIGLSGIKFFGQSSWRAAALALMFPGAAILLVP
jgi:hypothetical protein